MKSVAIVGAGMAGFGAAYRLRGEGGEAFEAVVYEKMPWHGGHTATYRSASAFLFDDGPHISFTKDPRIRELFARSVDGEYEEFHARVNNHWRGHWIKHPAQCNLYGLPAELVINILDDFIAARRSKDAKIATYRDWLIASFGETFAATFPMTYAVKYHTTEARNLGTDWLGPRIYRPDLNEVLRGALTPETSDVHYVDRFRYPRRNGFVSYLDGLAGQTTLRLEHELVAVQPASRRLRFANGGVATYDHLISSLPLPELIPMVEGAPDEVVEATRRLAWTSCVTVNVGVDRSDLSGSHWTYFYDHDYVFARLSFPHMFSAGNAPPGAGSIQAEIYYSDKYRPRDCEPGELVPAVLRDLRRCGLLREDDEVLFSEARVVPYANVIFDLERSGALKVVHGYLDELGIGYCGRYGEWGHHWTDESFVSGENAAQAVLG